MACPTKTTQTSRHVRSASFPPKTNLLVQKIELKLKTLQKSETSSTSPTETITIGLTGLAELYKCVDDVLSSPLNQHSLPLGHDDTKQLIDGSSKLLEICSGSRDALITLRKAVKDLDLKSEGDVSKYYSVRREIMRSAKKLSLSLVQVEASLDHQSVHIVNQEALEVTKALRCVSIINSSVLESLLQFLMSRTKTTKPSLFSKLVGKSKASSEERGNELSNVDVVLQSVSSKDAEKLQIAQKRLESLDVALKGIENGLSSISSQLTKIKSSFLNTVSL